VHSARARRSDRYRPVARSRPPTVRRLPLSRSALGPIALIGALLLLVGAAIVFFVLAVGLVRDMAGGTGATDGDATEQPAGVPTEALRSEPAGG
jgi:hypothetical protein